MKKIILIIAVFGLSSGYCQKTQEEIKLNLELIKEGNKIRNTAIHTAIIGTLFAYWGTTRKNGESMIVIGGIVASGSIPLTIIGNRKINKGIKKFN
jgi:hypothetical protein